MSLLNLIHGDQKKYEEQHNDFKTKHRRAVLLYTSEVTLRNNILCLKNYDKIKNRQSGTVGK